MYIVLISTKLGPHVVVDSAHETAKEARERVKYLQKQGYVCSLTYAPSRGFDDQWLAANAAKRK